MSGTTGSGIGTKGSVALDETHGRERCTAIGRARKSQLLATVVAVAAVPIMVIRPDDVDAATILARCLRSEEHTSELQSLAYLVCRLLLEKKKKTTYNAQTLRALTRSLNSRLIKPQCDIAGLNRSMKGLMHTR